MRWRERWADRRLRRGREQTQRAARRMGAEIIFDDEGRMLLADTPAGRADTFRAYDGRIAMEKRGHIISDGSSWNDEWLNAFKNIRKSAENPEIYVAYIIAQRHAAGLPELELEG